MANKKSIIFKNKKYMDTKMQKILNQININKQLAYKIEDELSSIEVPDDNQKAMLFTAFLQDTLSHYYAMNILIEKQLYNSAFALVRVFFDSIVRGLYVIYIDKEVFEKSNFPKTKNMCKELDKFLKTNIFEKIRTNTYGMMCDYAHVGQNQIARHFNEESGLIQPTFEDSLIIDTLRGNYDLLELFAKKYIAFFKKIGLL